MERFIISEILSLKEVAIFAVSMIFPGIIVAIYGVINRIVSPYITETKDIVEAFEFLKTIIIPIIYFFVFISVLGLFFIKVLIITFYPAQFHESILYAQIMWFFCAISVPATFLGNILRVHKILSFSIIFENINSFGKVLIGITLIKFFGLIGMVFTYSLFYLFSLLFFIFFFMYKYKKLLNEKSNLQA